jgi:hypothetical protein
MPRLTIGSRRAVAAVVGAAAATTLLTACQKPVPKVTVLGGGTVVTITPSDYCFSAQRCRTSALDLPTLTLGPDDKAMIDVPRTVESNGWQVQALSLQDITKVLGASGPIDGSHSYRVAGNVGGGDPFIVRVNELSGGKPNGSTWSFVVKVSPTKQ